MKNFLKKFLLILTINFAVLNPAWAGQSKEAENFVNDFGNKIIATASNKSFSVEERKQQLINQIESIVDSKWISRFVLATNYQSATQAQRDRFEGLYRDFMIYTYAPSFKGYNNEKFQVVDSIQQGKYYLVKCVFIPADSPKVNVSFRLKKAEGKAGFDLLDIIAEGVSLIETQRSEFGSVISAKGLDGFLDDLEARVKVLKTTPAKIQK